MKLKIILCLFVVFIQSCIRTLPDEMLTIARKPYIGTKIRMNGCYVSDPDELKYCEYNFFYTNGVCFRFSDLLNIENISQFTGGIDSERKYKGCWGLYQIENDTINAQGWKQSDIYAQFIIQKRYYNIINDTTLAIDLLNDGKIRQYHFKKFSTKPDSTNIFIK